MNLCENIQVCGKTDVGLKRENNEDHYLIIDHPTKDYNTACNGMMFAVADGMGGQAGGEIASQMACEGLSDYYAVRMAPEEDLSLHVWLLSCLEKTFRSTHEKILRFSQEHEGYDGMGTTLSALVLVNDRALITHVGDSRIYRLRSKRLTQLTVDHTMAELLRQTGHLNSEEASQHGLRHVLTQAMGTEIPAIHTRMTEVQRGDIFLLCSDGLYDVVAEADIKTILAAGPTFPTVCDRLLDAALENGGKDNVTVIVVQISCGA